MALAPPGSSEAAALCECTSGKPQCGLKPNWVVSQACAWVPWFGSGSNRVFRNHYVDSSCFVAANGDLCCE